MFSFVIVNIVTIKSAFIATLVFTVLFVSPAFALDSTASGKTPQVLKRTETKIATRAAALKTKLTQFKNQKKAEITDRINTNLNNINTKRTNEMLSNLNKMSTILDKLESRINSNSPDIKDTVSAKATVLSAKGVIASTSAMIQTQAQKDYTITVTSETKVKSDVQKVRTQLANDLQIVRKQVISAKQSVSNAIMTAKSGKSIEKEGTASGQQ